MRFLTWFEVPAFSLQLRSRDKRAGFSNHVKNRVLESCSNIFLPLVETIRTHKKCNKKGKFWIKKQLSFGTLTICFESPQNKQFHVNSDGLIPVYEVFRRLKPLGSWGRFIPCLCCQKTADTVRYSCGKQNCKMLYDGLLFSWEKKL